MGVIDEIRAERVRQIDSELYSSVHDGEHTAGELAKAAGCYALHAGHFGPRNMPPETYRMACNVSWPWRQSEWKPKSPRRDLVRAAALIVAEIERLDRIAAREKRQS